jgi:hypothetical protein
MAQLVMKRPPGAPLPPPGEFQHSRTAKPSDAANLARLMAAAFPEMEWTEARVHKDLLDAPTCR